MSFDVQNFVQNKIKKKQKAPTKTIVAPNQKLYVKINHAKDDYYFFREQKRITTSLTFKLNIFEISLNY